MEKNDRIFSFGSTASKRRKEPRPCLDTTSRSYRTFCGHFSSDSPASYLRLGYPHRSKGSQKGQKVPERVGGRKTNKDSQLDLCPKACIVAPALLVVPERVKPYRQGFSGVMDLALEGWGELSRWVTREVGVVCVSSEAGRMNNLFR